MGHESATSRLPWLHSAQDGLAPGRKSGPSWQLWGRAESLCSPLLAETQRERKTGGGRSSGQPDPHYRPVLSSGNGSPPSQRIRPEPRSRPWLGSVLTSVPASAVDLATKTDVKPLLRCPCPEQPPSLLTSTRVVASSLASWLPSCPPWPGNRAPGVSGGACEHLRRGRPSSAQNPHGSYLTGKKSQALCRLTSTHLLLPAFLSSSLPYCTRATPASWLSLPQGLCTFSTH